MPIQEISLGIVANDGEGNPLREGGEKINQNFTDPSNAASYEVGKESGQVPRNSDLPTFGGTGATDVPTNANLSASIAGTATFSGDVYTFSPSGTGFRPLQASMYLSFRLPSGSSNTTTTPEINYNGTSYVIKWIDGSALVADDLEQTYNKQPILFYFDGTDMLIASDISITNSDGDFVKYSNGNVDWVIYDTINSQVSGNTTYPLPLTLASADFFSGLSSNAGGGEATTDDLEFISNCAARSFSTTQVIINATLSEAGGSTTNKISIFGKGRWYE